ncbi:MAG TPA: HAD-IIIA family hydrolase [Bacteroidales bacterium]|nr:HAD-IIIA family hydrolase [Bacteroidales bacterium]
MMTKNASWPAAGKDWTLFLDRDGVINERPPGDYVRNIEGFKWLPGVLDALARLVNVFGRIIVITNQQGVGLGLMSQDQLDLVHQYMNDTIIKSGGKLDAVICCTMLRHEMNNCRKPSIRMALQAKEMFPEIDFGKSVMVGDTESDILFGKNAGMITVLVGNEDSSIVPDFKLNSLVEFTDIMTKSSEQQL